MELVGKDFKIVLVNMLNLINNLNKNMDIMISNMKDIKQN